ncbi:hypothetical protein Cgig2_010650 [Carnegiea gigantea]|uniref:Uncharacterized protein n=1 Tax=Carnegiea gigantea TaxID=171969 RepID=A0A9Q1Q676_9CARY|nr:hypothetical protein Cgig2_010650 [Carnegiea gigantea]
MACLNLATRKAKKRKQCAGLYHKEKYSLQKSYFLTDHTKWRMNYINGLIRESDRTCIDHLRMDRHTFFKLYNKPPIRPESVLRLMSATIHMMASPKDRSPGKNKRKWKEEHDALIEFLKDLVNDGTSFKADNRFKPAFLTTVAEKFKANLPESNLKDLCIVFGKDCTSGKDVQGLKEMEDEVKEELENKESSKKDEPESSSPPEPSGVEASSRKSGNLGKWVRAFDNLVKSLLEVTSIIGRQIRATSSNISRAIDFDVELSKKHSKLNKELANLGLTTMERHHTVRKIAFE